MKNFFNLHLDSLGFSASLICAIHCAVVPVLLTVSTWGGLQLLNDPSIELSILCVSTLLALLSILPSYLRIHRKLNAIVFVCMGFILIGLGRLEVSKVWEILFTTVGAMLVAIAHYLNWWLCKQCRAIESNRKNI
jgi:hypothetical protein